MTVLTEEVVDFTLDDFGDVVGEMSNDSTAVSSVPIDQKLLDRYMQLDPDPHECKFVTVEIKSGFSKSNRNWRPEILEAIAKQVNEQHPVGNKGHIKKEDYESVYPEPQTVWLGAVCERKGNQAVLKVKGYNLPGSDIRNHLKFKAVNSVSVYGKSKMRPIPGGHEVLSFDLETIDWSRKNRSGMDAKVVALTSENQPQGGNTVEAKDIAALGEDELRTHAPLLVKEIERKATEPLDTKVGEMQGVIDASKPAVDTTEEIRKLLKLEEGDNVVEKVTALLSRIEDTAKSEIKDFIKELVGKKVKTERGQGLVLRLVGEMESEYDGPLNDELKKKITEDFDAKVEADEDVKAIIGEMGSSDGPATGGAALGGRSRAGEDRGRVGAGENSKTRKVGTVTIESRRFGA